MISLEVMVSMGLRLVAYPSFPLQEVSAVCVCMGECVLICLEKIAATKIRPARM